MSRSLSTQVDNITVNIDSEEGRTLRSSLDDSSSENAERGYITKHGTTATIVYDTMLCHVGASCVTVA